MCYPLKPNIFLSNIKNIFKQFVSILKCNDDVSLKTILISGGTILHNAFQNLSLISLISFEYAIDNSYCNIAVVKDRKGVLSSCNSLLIIIIICQIKKDSKRSLNPSTSLAVSIKRLIIAVTQNLNKLSFQ